jgi:phage terminase large subunit-like protein
MYCDPFDLYSEIGQWSVDYGDKRVFEWPTNSIKRMFQAIRRFEVDLSTGRIGQDGCPIVAVHMANARKVSKPGQQYVLGKPKDHQKIDAAMARILAHEAAADARKAGWGDEPEPTDSRMFVFK